MEQALLDFYTFIRKESTEYVCATCGDYSMKNKNIDLVNDYKAEVLLECHRCGWLKPTTMTKFD